VIKLNGRKACFKIGLNKNYLILYILLYGIPLEGFPMTLMYLGVKK